MAVQGSGSIPRAPEHSCKNSYDLALAVPKGHLLLIKQVTKGQPEFRRDKAGTAQKGLVPGKACA